ncbi:MAG: outer membrane protein assembly factor BamD [Pirellulaceae bacterium]|nr:outer membrane protein assembly factor BamD [Pirellulaceae bacterium]MDP7018857.1 outer membrane protein assembly factor BamD [Pirellulaceae bacterium]
MSEDHAGPHPLLPPLAATGGLPSEPPVHFSVRVSSSFRRRHWWRDRLTEAPCWLASMFFHLVFVVVLGSMTPPPTRVQGLDLIVRSHVRAEDQADEGDGAVVLQGSEETEDVRDEGDLGDDSDEPDPMDEVDESDPLEEEQNDPTEESDVDMTDEDSSEPIDELPTEEESPEPMTTLVADNQDVKDGPLFEAPVRPLSDDPSELLDNLVPVSAFAPRSAWSPLSWVHSAPIRPELKQLSESDDHVSRFIEYDIGELRGEPGQRARRNFEQMGPSAIPALVRGLNKSASIQASCPVGVISTRLTRELKQCDDPAMIRYALENIGRGVPVEAPHYLRIESLQARLRDHFTEQDKRFQRILTERRTPVSAEMLGRLNRLGNGKYADLLASLDDPDERARITALIAVEVADPRLTRPQRHELAARLILELRMGTPETKKHAHYSLSALAHRYLADPPTTYTNTPGLADDWEAAWREREVNGPGERARAIYSQAQRLERTGQVRMARLTYGRLVNDYGDTQYGKLARSQLTVLSPEPYAEGQLRLANTLKDLGRTAAALRRYRDIVRNYPQTPAAAQAVIKIEEIEQEGGPAVDPLKGKIESAFDAF